MGALSLFAKSAWKECRIALPEGEDGRILQAARMAKDRGLASPFFVGEKRKIEAAAGKIGVEIGDIHIVDISGGVPEKYISAYGKIRKAAPKIAERILSNPLFFAALKNGSMEKALRWYARHFKEIPLMAPLYAAFKAATGSGVSFREFRKYLESVLDVKSDTLLVAFEAMVNTGDRIGELMEGLRVPVLVLTGENDFLVQPVSLEILKGRLMDCEMHILEKATHFPHAERPGKFNRLIGEFVSKLDG